MKKSYLKNYQKNIYDDEDSGFVFILTLLIPSFLSTLIVTIIALIFEIVDIEQNFGLMSAYILLSNFFMFGIYCFYNKALKINWIKAGLIKFKVGWVNILICFFISIITLFGSLYLVNYLMYLIQQLGYSFDSSLPLPLTNGWWLILNIFLLAVLPAICEELLYRGIIFNGLRKLGNIKAVFISALFFALAHGSAMQLFYQFILGIVLAFVVLKTGSLLTSMLVHFLNNFIVVLYNYITINNQNAEISFSPGLIAIAFGAAIFAGLLLWILIKFLKEKKEDFLSSNESYFQIYESGSKKFSSKKSIYFFTFSLIIALALWCLGTFA